MKDEQRIKQIISSLGSIELKEDSVDQITSILEEIMTDLPIVEISLNPGTIITRGRPFNTTEDFSEISCFSYKPKNLNNNYQRASIPNETMLYGSLNSIKNSGLNGKNCVLFEIGNVIKQEENEEILMFSFWTVTTPITLIGIVQSQYYSQLCDFSLTLKEQYEKTFKLLPERDLMNYIASEFSKKDISNQYDYLISAIFTHLSCKEKYDGVLYPSVKCNGAGLNVAIRPTAVDEKLKFGEVFKCEITNVNNNIETLVVERSVISEDGNTLSYIPYSD